MRRGGAIVEADGKGFRIDLSSAQWTKTKHGGSESDNSAARCAAASRDRAGLTGAAG